MSAKCACHLCQSAARVCERCHKADAKDVQYRAVGKYSYICASCTEAEKQPLTVGDLRKILSKLPASTPLATQRYSECRRLVASDVFTLWLFDNGGYLSQSYSAPDQDKAVLHLFFDGN